MDVDEILALERELTDEEFVFLEQETLKVMRVIRKRVGELLPIIQAHDARLAERMEVSANRMLWSLEEGIRLPIGDRIAETAALKELTLDVRRMYIEVMGVKPTDVRAPSAAPLPRRERRRLRGKERGRGVWRGPREPAPDEHAPSPT